MSAALGFFPFYNRPGVCNTRKLTTTAAPWMVLMADAVNDPSSAKKATGAGVTAVLGVIVTPQGDPNNSGNFAIGDLVDVAETGNVPVLFDAGTVLTREATIISGATAGTAKVLGAEAKPYDVIGYYAGEAKTIGGSPDVGSVRLDMHRVEA